MITKEDIGIYSIKSQPPAVDFFKGDYGGGLKIMRVKFMIRGKIECKCDVPSAVPLSNLNEYIVNFLNNGEPETK